MEEAAHRQPVGAGTTDQEDFDLHAWLAAALYVVACVTILAADSIAVPLVRQIYGPAAYGWPPDATHRVADTVRILGGMAFLAGLAERVVGAILRRLAPAAPR